MFPHHRILCKVLQSENPTDGFVRVCITLRIVRHPIIGDKFASRHGQKGVCSLRFAYEVCCAAQRVEWL